MRENRLLALSIGTLLLTCALACEGKAAENRGAVASERRFGGPCEYADYEGTATITRVEKTEQSSGQAKSPGGPGYEGYEVWFRFGTDQEVRQEFARPKTSGEQLFKLANSWHPGERYIKKYGVEPGKSYRCVFKVITKGTCTPTIFDMTGLKKDDYFESSR